MCAAGDAFNGLLLFCKTPHPPLTRSPFPHWGRLRKNGTARTAEDVGPYKVCACALAPSVRDGCTRRAASRGVFPMGKHPEPNGDWGSFAESKTPSVGSAATSLTEGGKKSCLCTVRVVEAPTPTEIGACFRLPCARGAVTER